MLLFKQRKPLHEYLATQRSQELTIGFVPTMGALHEGHISLIGAARKQSEIVVCSIFVNPAQFNDPSDFEQYPVTVDRDILMLSDAGADILFLPEVEEMYPEGLAPADPYDFGDLEHLLEGRHRPGHFQGVARIMQKLLETIQPGLLFMGQKDFQQCLVVRSLIRLLSLKTALVVLPTRREADGLAMSSRNRRLTAEYRQKAPAIYHGLQYIRAHAADTPLPLLCRQVSGRLRQEGFEPDYVTVASAANLRPLDKPEDRMVALIAARIGDIRLIDNMEI